MQLKDCSFETLELCQILIKKPVAKCKFLQT